MNAGSRLNMTIAQLRRLGRERSQELLCLSALWLLLPLISGTLLLALADVAIHFSIGWRWVAFLILIAGYVAGAVWLIRLARRRLSLQAIAVLVEKACPAADNRIINAIQFHEQGNVKASFIEGILSEPGVRLEQISGNQLYPKRSRQWLLRAYPVALVIWLLPFCFAPAGMMTSLARIFAPFAGIRPHSRTIILEVTPGDLAVKRGQEVEVTARLAGEISAKPRLQLENATEAPSELEMLAGEWESFTVTTAPLYATTRYRVVAGDAVTEWMHLDIAPVPGIVRWEAAVAPPPHTGRKNYFVKHDQESMEVMPGSTMIFAGVATVPLSSIAILQGEQEIAHAEASGKEFNLKANLVSDAPMKIKLVSREEVEAAVRAMPDTAKWVGAGSIVKVIVVPGRIVNIVVK